LLKLYASLISTLVSGKEEGREQPSVNIYIQNQIQSKETSGIGILEDLILAKE
jgi:hypothetical protein